MNGLIYTVAVQLLGLLGILCNVLAFQCRSHKRIMILKTLNESIFAIQYFLLGAYTGVVMNVVGSARNLIFSAMVERERKTTPAQVLFSIFFVVFGLCTGHGWMSLMVICAKVLTTVAFGIKNPALLRVLTLPTSVCWFIYNTGCGSYAGAVCELLTITSLVTAIIRIDIPSARKAKTELSQS